jgi:hypothetical protein
MNLNPKREHIVLTARASTNLIQALCDCPSKNDLYSSSFEAIFTAIDWATALDRHLNPRRLPFGHTGRIEGAEYTGWSPRVRIYHARIGECFDRLLKNLGWGAVCEDQPPVICEENIPISALWKERPARLIDELARATQGLLQELERMGITPQTPKSNDSGAGSEDTKLAATPDLSGKAERKTENPEKHLPNIPQNSDVLRLAKRIKKEYGKTAKTKKEIAMDFTENDKEKANNLLRQLRTFKHLLE